MIEMRWYVPVSGNKVLQYRYKHDVGGPYPNIQWSEWQDVPEYVERDMDCP